MLSQVFSENNPEQGIGLPAYRRQVARDILRIIRANPHQWKVIRAIQKNQRVCNQANRRGGKTTTISLFLLARVIARDNYSVRILANRLSIPTQTWMATSSPFSLTSILRDTSLNRHVTELVRSAGSITKVRFSWGSEITIHEIGTFYAAEDKHRGITGDFWWVDEAQSCDYLTTALASTVNPLMGDGGGEARLVLSGTPGREVDSAFKVYSEGGDGDWESISCYSWQNPAYGETFEERWAHVNEFVIKKSARLLGLTQEDIDKLAALKENELEQIAKNSSPAHLKEWVEGLDPHLRREILGAWVVSDSDYVLSWRSAPDEFYWAQATKNVFWETTPTTLQTVGDSLEERYDALPKNSAGYPCQWRTAVGLDLGWNYSATAWVVIAWSPAHPDQLFVVWSKAEYKMDSEAIQDETVRIVSVLRQKGAAVHAVRADVNGTLMNVHATWSSDFKSRFPNTPFYTAQKANKESQLRALDFDIKKATVRVVAGDPIDIEGRYLQFKPQKDTEDKIKINKNREVSLPNGEKRRPGDHCLDALRYVRPECPYSTKKPELEPVPDLIGDKFVDYRAQQPRLNFGKRSPRRRQKRHDLRF